MPILRVNRPFKLESLPLVSATQGFWDFSSGSLLDLSAAKNDLIGAPIYSRDSRLLAYNPTGILATDRLSLADTVITTSSHFAFWAIIKREAGSTLRLFGRGKDGSGNGWSIDCWYTSAGYMSAVVVNNTYYEAKVAPDFHKSDWQFVATILQQGEFVEPSHISSLIDFNRTRTGLAGFSKLRTSTIGSAIGIGAQESLSSGGGSFVAMSGIENLAGMTEAAALTRVYAIRDTILPKFNLPQQRNIWIAAAGGISPGTGAITVTGYAPAIQQPITVSPGAGAIIITGYGPTISQPQTIAPGLGSVLLAGLAPDVLQPLIIAPALGSVVCTGLAPVIVQGSSLMPGLGSIIVQGLAPSISQSTGIAPGLGEITCTGLAPAISQPRTIAPSIGVVTFTGLAPEISQAATINPATGAIVVQGLVPTISQPQTLAPGLGAAVYQGLAPTISQGISLAPGTGQIIFTGLNPSILQPRTLSPGLGSAVYQGYAPSLGLSDWDGEEFSFESPIIFEFAFSSAITTEESISSPI